MPRFELAKGATDRKAEDSADRFSDQIIALMPRLSAFALCLTGTAEQCDDLVRETYACAIANKDQWQPSTQLDSWVLRIAQNLWFDRQRANKFRTEPEDIETADQLVGSGGRTVTENSLVLADLLRALDRLSPQHRALIALVSVCDLTYAEAAEILSIPVETVMRRLARGRLALYDAVNAATASRLLDIRNAT